MELTISIKGPKNIASFLNLIRKFDYVEIVDVKELDPDLPIEHRKLLDERLMRVKKGKATFKNWDSMKKKYHDLEIEDNTELYQWQKDLIDERLEKIAKGEEKFQDFETAIDEIEKEL